MTEKELLYVEDAINHEIYMITTCKEVEDCLTDENLVKLVKKIGRKHEGILSMFMDLLSEEGK